MRLMPEQSDTLMIRMTARTWATIDGEMNSTGSTSRVDGPQEWARMADEIRHEGRRQVPWVNGQWPPMAQQIKVSLTREQWTFILDRTEASTPIYREIGDDESADLGVDAARTLREAGI